MGDIINAGLDLFGLGPASKQADATTDAANVAAQSQREATQLQREMWQAQQAQQQPWVTAGTNALAKLQGVSDYTKFGMDQFQQDPGYAFRLSEGQKSLDRSAAARGGLISGSALKAAQRYGQDMGSQEYTNAFNRYQTERTAQLGPLQSLAGVGQTAVNQLGASGQNYANQAGNLAMIGGANQANALLSQGNIRASQYDTLGRGAEQLYDYGKTNNWWGNNSPSTVEWT